MKYFFLGEKYGRKKGEREIFNYPMRGQREDGDDSSWRYLRKGQKAMCTGCNKENTYFQGSRKDFVMVSKHYKNNLSCEIFTFMDSQKSSGPARIHLDFILSGGGLTKRWS